MDSLRPKSTVESILTIVLVIEEVSHLNFMDMTGFRPGTDQFSAFLFKKSYQ
jgi:hypothetical protein